MNHLIRTVLNTDIRKPRQIGYTTQVANSARELGGKVVCANKEHAKQVSQGFGVDTITPHQVTDSMACILFWDSFAFTEIAREFGKLESQIQAKDAEIKEIKDAQARHVDHMNKIIEQLQTKDALIQELIECVGFYGDGNNWDSPNKLAVDDYLIGQTGQTSMGGKKARILLNSEAVKEWGKSRGN